jgi:hypothetical protein
MTPPTYAFIKLEKFMDRNFLKGKYGITIHECQNEYHKDKLPTIPYGTHIKYDFGCDSGVYGIADINGILYKILVPLDQIHNLHIIENNS